jgi:hypothetical protein
MQPSCILFIEIFCSPVVKLGGVAPSVETAEVACRVPKTIRPTIGSLWRVCIKSETCVRMSIVFCWVTGHTGVQTMGTLRQLLRGQPSMEFWYQEEIFVHVFVETFSVRERHLDAYTEQKFRMMKPSDKS